MSQLERDDSVSRGGALKTFLALSGLKDGWLDTSMGPSGARAGGSTHANVPWASGAREAMKSGHRDPFATSPGTACMLTNTTQTLVRRRRTGRAAQGCLAAGLLLSAACSVADGGEGATTDGGLDIDAADSVTPQHAGDGGHATSGDGGHASRHPCGQPYPKDPRDDTMTGELVRVVTNDNGTPSDPSDDQYDVLLPQEMLDWLNEQNWIQEHGDWHNVRRWDQGCQRFAPDTPCQNNEAMIARGLSRASIQEGEPGDGYTFLIMHRHMIRGFQQAFPKHVEQIRGFHRVPTDKDDPENPIPWIDVRWSDDQLETIAWMENISEHVDAFESEDDYAQWVQSGGLMSGGGGPGFPGGFGDGGFPGGVFPGDGGFPGFPGGGPPGSGSFDAGVSANPSDDATPSGDGGTPNRPGGGIHAGLHGQWSVPGSPSSLIDNNKNVQNFAFWRLHVWIDDMWERYRQARGLGEDDPDYQQALIGQCEEMHLLGEALPIESQNAGDAGADSGTSDPTETGVFATQIAPIFNSYCGGSVCHGADSPTLGLALAGAQPSVIRAGLVGQQASEAAMALVEPGEPEQSWLYLKITDNFAAVDCNTSRCTAMPPAGVKPNAQEVERIRSWIAAGATAD
jgi:hypothetical protein